MFATVLSLQPRVASGAGQSQEDVIMGLAEVSVGPGCAENAAAAAAAVRPCGCGQFALPNRPGLRCGRLSVVQPYLFLPAGHPVQDARQV